MGPFTLECHIYLSSPYSAVMFQYQLLKPTIVLSLFKGVANQNVRQSPTSPSSPQGVKTIREQFSHLGFQVQTCEPFEYIRTLRKTVFYYMATLFNTNVIEHKLFVFIFFK